MPPSCGSNHLLVLFLPFLPKLSLQNVGFLSVQSGVSCLFSSIFLYFLHPPVFISPVICLSTPPESLNTRLSSQKDLKILKSGFFFQTEIQSLQKTLSPSTIRRREGSVEERHPHSKVQFIMAARPRAGGVFHPVIISLFLVSFVLSIHSYMFLSPAFHSFQISSDIAS